MGGNENVFGRKKLSRSWGGFAKRVLLLGFAVKP